MAWKYVMFENRKGDSVVLFPVIFPDKMTHADLMTLRPHMPGWDHDGVRPISAGMIGSLTVLGLGGESHTLGIESRPEDKETIESYAYLHGIQP